MGGLGWGSVFKQTFETRSRGHTLVNVSIGMRAGRRLRSGSHHAELVIYALSASAAYAVAPATAFSLAFAL